MKEDDFFEIISIKKNWEFLYKGKNYNFTYGKDLKGDYILFGETFFGQKFYSYNDFMNNAMIDNTFFREILPDL